MTFTYSNASASVRRSRVCPHHSGTFLDFLALSGTEEIDLLAPLSGQANVRARKPSAAYILQKDPDGSWFIDRWVQDTAAQVRPVPAVLPPDGYRAAASDNAAYFIIEIG